MNFLDSYQAELAYVKDLLARNNSSIQNQESNLTKTRSQLDKLEAEIQKVTDELEKLGQDKSNVQLESNQGNKN